MMSKKGSTAAKKMGRPPKGAGGDAPEKVKDYPKVTLYILPRNKERLKAAAVVLDVPEWQLMERAFEAYWKTLPPKTRRVATQIVETRGR